MVTEYLVKVALLGAEWVLYALIILSGISVAFIIERVLVVKRTGKVLQAIEDRSLGLPGCEKLKCENSTEMKLLALVKETAEKTGTENMELLQGQLEGIVGRYRRHLERYTAFLGTLGNNAPFLGLLGTCIGVIDAFFQLGVNVDGGAGAVMAGISEALVATATGIAVALPAVVAYNFISKAADQAVERFVQLAWTVVRGGKI